MRGPRGDRLAPALRAAPELTELNLADLVQRAARPLSTTPRPFLKWAGSKRSLLPDLVPVLPASFRRYWEPFLGSGSLFFLLQPAQAVLGDKCDPLIRTYRAVREHPGAVLSHMRSWDVNKEHYYAVRDERPRDRFRRAAQFIYLNKTCWNGLYRVNSEGKFNVPYGAPRTNQVVDEENLRATSRGLRRPGVELVAGDFVDATARVQKRDLVFLDPPYVVSHNNNGFRDYNETLFSWEDQERLAMHAAALASRGAHVIVTNADHREVHRLYRDFDCRIVRRNSTLAASTTRRTAVTEVVFSS